MFPTLTDRGGLQLFPEDPSVGPLMLEHFLISTYYQKPDRRPALVAVLKTMLVSYSHLLNALLAPLPPASSGFPPESLRHLDWIGNLSQNIMAAANDMRPVQVRILTHVVSQALTTSRLEGTLSL